MEKIKISPFEYAIRTVAEPHTIENYEPYTEEEVRQQRISNVQKQASKMRVLKPEPPTK